jgi:hypothetical protein
VAVHVTCLVLQLLLQAIGGVGFAAQGRTADGRADQGEVDPRLPELRPDLLVLDLIQTPGVPADLPPFGVPALLSRDRPDRIDRIVIQNQAERERVVGVEQQRELLVPAQVIEKSIGQGSEVGIEVLGVLF